MKCLNCSTTVSAFSEEWQAQREQATKRCPSCGVQVESVIDGATYVKWLAAIAALVAAITLTITGSMVHAVIYGLTLGLPMAVLPSFVLRQHKAPTGLRRALNRSIPAPAWLRAPSWLARSASAAWAIIGYCSLLTAVALGVPSPWSGILLLGLGALSFVPRQHSPGSRTHAVSAARLGGIGMVLVGLGLLAHRYA